MRRLFGFALISIGIFGLAYNFIYGYIGEKKSQEVISEFEWFSDGQETDSLSSNGNGTFNGNATSGNSVSNNAVPHKGSEGSKKPNSRQDNNIKGKVVAVLTIPAINIKYPVVSGTDPETLKHSLGYFEGTALPGQTGNFAVAGHRNSSYARYFNRLDEIKKGDEIIVETRSNKYVYSVTEVFKVHKNQTDVLNQTKDKSITLITCTNGYKPKYRIIVKGKLK